VFLWHLAELARNRTNLLNQSIRVVVSVPMDSNRCCACLLYCSISSADSLRTKAAGLPSQY
jgi:hypothetical protein